MSKIYTWMHKVMYGNWDRSMGDNILKTCTHDRQFKTKLFVESKSSVSHWFGFNKKNEYECDMKINVWL